jgi:thioredoxin reductase (NADPH)
MLKPVLISGFEPGGQLMITTDVENYPGFADVIQGPWLMEQMRLQAEHVGTEMISDHVTAVDLSRRPFTLTCDSGAVYTCDALIIATGAKAKWLGLPSEEVQGLRRLGLRHLRRLLLSRQGRRGGRRRQFGGGGGAVSRQSRQQGDAGASPRQPARRENPAGPPARPSEVKVVWDSAIDEICGRRTRSASPMCAAQRQDRRDHRAARPTASSSPSATSRRPNCSPASST